MLKLSFKNILTLFILTVTSTLLSYAQQGEVVIHQDPRITELLDLKTELVKDNKLSDRYKIQLYSGSLSTASATLKKFRNKVGTYTSDIKHETPNYKVWIGNFRNRLEADRALIAIKEDFPSAFIFKPDRS